MNAPMSQPNCGAPESKLLSIFFVALVIAGSQAGAAAERPKPTASPNLVANAGFEQITRTKGGRPITEPVPLEATVRQLRHD